MIHILPQLTLSPTGELKVYRQLLHLRQGDMDGACAIYSLIMDLIAIKCIKRSLADNIWMKVKGNTREGKLINHIVNNQGLYRNGVDMSDLANQANEIYHRILDVKYLNGKQESVIAEEIDNGRPCVVSFSYNKHSGHAMTAVGYEMHNKKITKIFCLDPARPAPISNYWNAAIALNHFEAAKYTDLYIPNGNQVVLDEIITITPKG